MRITCWLLALALLLATVQAQRRTSSSRSSSSSSSSSSRSSSSRVRSAVSRAGSRIKSAASSLGSRIKSSVSSGGSRSSGSSSSSLLGGSSSSSSSLLGGSSSSDSRGSGSSGLSSTLKGLAGSVLSSSGSKTGSSSSGSGLGSTLKGLAGAALSSSGSKAGSSSSGSGLSSTLKGLAGAALGSSGSKTGSSSSGSGGLSSTLKGLAGSLASSGSKTGSAGSSGSGLSSTLKGLAGAIGSSGTKTGSSSTSGSGLSSTLKGLAGAALGSKAGSSSSSGSKSSIVKSIAGALFKSNKNGVKQYSAYSPPPSSLGSRLFGSSKKSYGYKTPGYGTAWGTSFPGGLGEYKKRAGVSKKALGLGVGAGFLAGAGLGVAGTVATYSVYHRYQEFKRLRAQQGRGHFFDQDYYSNYYSSNQCQYGCPATTHCEWGLCECNAGTSRRYGRCQSSWDSAVADTSLAVFKPCLSHPDCTSRDINLVCNTALTTGGEGRCECRPDMRWQSQAGECQLYLDVDCTRVTYSSQPSSAVLQAVRRLLQQQHQTGQAIVGRTESYQESLSSSLLSQLNPNTTTEDQLTEAYCRDVDALSFEFERQVVQGAPTSPPSPRGSPGQSSGKPRACAEVPSSACAVAYDSGDCGGGWVLPIAEGEQRFKFFSSFYTYRNDIDTVGVRAGCTLTAFEDSSFNGDQVTVRAGNTDRWVVLAETPGYQHMSEQIESVKCQCVN